MSDSISGNLCRARRTVKPRKYNTFLVERPSGEWERFNIPNAWRCWEVAERFPHSEVYWYLPAGFTLYYSSGPFYGPLWLHVSADSSAEPKPVNLVCIKRGKGAEYVIN